jgi:hypothetical protein
MNILEQLAALGALLADLGVKLEESQKALDEATKAAYDKGFADGVKSVVVEPSDKIFSQEEADALVAEAVLPLEKKIKELEVVIAGIDKLVADKLADFKAELLAKYNDLQVAETAAEVGFGDLLK